MKKLLRTLKTLDLKTILYIDNKGMIPESLFELIQEYIPNILIIVLSTKLRYREKNNAYMHIYRPSQNLDMLVEIDLLISPSSFIDDANLKNYKYALFLVDYYNIEIPTRKYFYFPNEQIKTFPLFVQNFLVRFKRFRDKTLKYELLTCATI